MQTRLSSQSTHQVQNSGHYLPEGVRLLRKSDRFDRIVYSLVVRFVVNRRQLHMRIHQSHLYSVSIFRSRMCNIARNTIFKNCSERFVAADNDKTVGLLQTPALLLSEFNHFSSYLGS